MKMAQADLEQEKERSLKREQEAFAARYELVGVQEELSQVHEQVKLVEQERDALRAIAQNEEVARIAAEGRLPLPKANEDDEFASPKKARKSMDLATITTSAASEEEMDNLRMSLDWERQRANRAHDRVEFLELECRMNCCISKAIQSRSASASMPEKIQSRRSSTVVRPAEDIFGAASPAPEEQAWISPANEITPSVSSLEEPRSFARTPSCEPPAAALLTDYRASLLSILDVPQSPSDIKNEEDNYVTMLPAPEETDEPEEESPVKHNMIPTFHTISTTTKIPLANAPDLTPTLLPSAADPALSPTMSREEALAQIRERRGRARSLAQGTMTPRKQMLEGGGLRRDISAPTIRSGGVRGRSQARG